MCRVRCWAAPATCTELGTSLDALLFLLEKLGFRSVRLLEFGPDDYEQYVRGSRVIVHGQK